MTWDLAESGKHFITTIINGSDLVPTFSAASVDDLRTEVFIFSSVDHNCETIVYNGYNLPYEGPYLKVVIIRLQHLRG